MNGLWVQQMIVMITTKLGNNYKTLDSKRYRRNRLVKYNKVS